MNALKDSYIALAATTDIQEICKPLEQLLGELVFGYYKLLPNGQEICLSSDLNWTRHVYENNLTARTDIETFSLKTTKFFLWPFPSHCSDKVRILEPIRKIWKCHYGLSLSNGKDEYFGVSIKNRTDFNIINVYMNNLEPLEHFCNYFADKAQHIINAASKVPMLFCNPKPSINLNQKFMPLKNTNNLLQEIQLKRRQLLLSYFPNFNLTLRETDCLKLFIKGYTTSEAAINLGISTRTVETYLENIKNKTDLYKKSDLIKFIFTNNIDKYL